MKTAVFAGTTEGRLICEYLSQKNLGCTAFAATPLGAELLPKNTDVRCGRLDRNGIESSIKGFDMVIDATHPYAKEVTENIKAACDALGVKYIRLLRDEEVSKNALYFGNIDEAAEYLSDKEGSIFVSTGSKEAQKYTAIPDYEDRVTVRVLDTGEPEEKCRSLGFKNIISARGPFSCEDNIKHFKGCRYLVTKSSGKAGGFAEKIEAAQKLGMEVLVIKRPEEEGYTMEEVKGIIDKAAVTEPSAIERRSFEIIEEHLKGRTFPEGQRDIIKRVIHTTADFDYADNLVFSDGAVDTAIEALKRGAQIVTDTNMAMAGINKRVLASIGGSVRCFMADENVAAEAKQRNITRAAVSMERAAKLGGNLIIVSGNAPTALIACDRLIKSGMMKPVLIIGVPVGFVNVVESKELIMQGSVPYIVAKGNKGGSNVAAAIVNALLYKIKR